MSWDSNMYYSPASYGLRILTEVNDPWAAWSFNMLVVWVNDETGAVYYGSDSGCSCPSPFESFALNSPRLARVDGTQSSWDDFVAYVDWYYQSIADYQQENSHSCRGFRADCSELQIAVQHYLQRLES